MCLIVYFDPAIHTAPDREILQRGLKSNPHGAGLLRLTPGGAWARERRLECTPRQLDRWIDDCMGAGRTWAIHFRWSTGGEKSKANCHPFDLGGGNFLMHNGTLTIDPTKTASDTAVLAAWIKREGLGARLRAMTPIVDGLRRGSRLLVAGPGGTVDLWGEWHQETHGTYSNKNCHWAPAPPRVTYYPREYTPGAMASAGHYSQPTKAQTTPATNAPILVGTWCTDRLCYVDDQGICRRWNHDRRAFQVVPDPNPSLPRPGFDLVAPKYRPLHSLGNHQSAELWEEPTTEVIDLADLLAEDDYQARNFRRPYDWS
jgi:hypothetical protein